MCSSPVVAAGRASAPRRTGLKALNRVGGCPVRSQLNFIAVRAARLGGREKTMESNFDKDEVLREAEEIIRSREPEPALKLLGEILGYWGQSEKLFEETFELVHKCLQNLEGSFETMENSLKLSKDFQKIVGQLLGIISKRG